MEPYFFHGFRDYNVDTVCRVLESGFILPRKMIVNGTDDINNIFNGNAWISLSQKSVIDPYPRYRMRIAYNEWVHDQLCAVISPNIDGITYTNYIDSDECYKDWREQVVRDDNPYRFSYYFDEVQTNVPIPVEKFLALGYPLSVFLTKKGKDGVKCDLDRICDLLLKKDLDIPIVDSSIYDFADDRQHIVKSKIR